jgi:hypothetical protein
MLRGIQCKASTSAKWKRDDNCGEIPDEATNHCSPRALSFSLSRGVRRERACPEPIRSSSNRSERSEEARGKLREGVPRGRRFLHPAGRAPGR